MESGVEGVEVADELPFAVEVGDIPVGFVVVAYFEDEFGEVFLLADGPPDVGIGDGFEADVGAHVSEDGLLPPHHHVIDVLLDQVVQPHDVLHPLDVLEVAAHQLVEALQLTQRTHHL